jgi:hypothetical protein
MELESLLPYSQYPDTGAYPEPDKSNPHTHVLFICKISVFSFNYVIRTG